MPPIPADAPLFRFVQALSESIQEGLSQSLNQTWNVTAAEQTSGSAEDPLPVGFGFLAFGALEGEAAIGLRETDALALARILLSEPPQAANELNPEGRAAIEKLLQRWLESTGARLSKSVGALELKLETAATPVREGTEIDFSLSNGSDSTLHLALTLGRNLLDSMAAAANGAAHSETVALEPSDANFDLLLGVNLNLTLRFGQRVMTLREILDLGSGSVIELDRQVQEPADLLLGDRLIARGEVVIVDSNYGIRITEVADPHQRMAGA